jgi:hypothetical protein
MRNKAKAEKTSREAVDIFMVASEIAAFRAALSRAPSGRYVRQE